MNKSSISVSLVFSLISGLTSNSMFQNESTALEFDFGGDNGFHFDLGNFPGTGGQGPQGEQGPK